MKKFILYTLTAFLAFTFVPNEVKATTGSINTVLPTDSVASKNSLVTRLDEIKSLDKSNMSHSEKQALRKEVKSIDKTLHDNYGGVYISVGGLLLIILILILIF